MPALVPGRERVAWIAGFLLVSTIIVGSGFTSPDPDSALYAGMAARLAEEPVVRWVAPEWWDFWPAAQMSGLFREHPAGVFWIPAGLSRLGLPAEQGAYLVGVGAGLVALVMVGMLVQRVTSREDARAVLVLLQVMPVAFVFRIRANHEYPMLAALLLVLLGLHGLRRAWWPVAVVAAGMAVGLVVKGVFLSLILLGAGLWLLLDPPGAERRSARPWLGYVVALGVTAVVAAAYDFWYLAATGERFWSAYLGRQLGPVTVASPWEDPSSVLWRLGFYVTRLLWHPAPWSLLLLWLGLSRTRAWRDLPRRERHGLVFALTFAALVIAVLALPSRYAVRNAFSAMLVIGAAGAVAARRGWPRLAQTVARMDERVVALPAVTWTVLAVARLALGPWLPRP